MTLEVDNIELGFAEKKVLYGVYLKAETGKVTGILGRNGSGKTSLLRIIFGDLTPKYKNIRKDGIHQKKRLFSTNTIIYLPQYGLLPHNLKLATAFKWFNVPWEDFVTEFKSFGKYSNCRVLELSSGERRVGRNLSHPIIGKGNYTSGRTFFVHSSYIY